MHSMASGSFRDLVSASREGQGLCPSVPSPQTPELGSWLRPCFCWREMGGKQRRDWDPGKILLAGSAPPGLWRGEPVPDTGDDPGESGAQGAEVFLPRSVRGQQYTEDQARVAGFKDVVKDSSGAF